MYASSTTRLLELAKRFDEQLTIVSGGGGLLLRRSFIRLISLGACFYTTDELTLQKEAQFLPISTLKKTPRERPDNKLHRYGKSTCLRVRISSRRTTAPKKIATAAMFPGSGPGRRRGRIYTHTPCVGTLSISFLASPPSLCGTCAPSWHRSSSNIRGERCTSLWCNRASVLWLELVVWKKKGVDLDFQYD